MRISTLDSPSSSLHFKKSRNAYRPFDLINLLPEPEDEFFIEEDDYYIRRFKRKKDGHHELYYSIRKERKIEKDYKTSLIQQLNYIKQPLSLNIRK